jgi:hypothetical protein
MMADETAARKSLRIEIVDYSRSAPFLREVPRKTGAMQRPWSVAPPYAAASSVPSGDFIFTMIGLPVSRRHLRLDRIAGQPMEMLSTLLLPAGGGQDRRVP